MIRFLKTFWPVILLTIVGAFLRFYRLEASLQFLGDQGRDALVLKNMLVNHDLPFIGPITSVGGFYLGPLYYYLMAPFLWFFRFNPAGPAYATAAIGVITIPAIYFTAKKMFSASTAFWASLLYTIGSVPVTETRGAWNPNPMPLASLGVIWGFYKAQTTKDHRWLWLSALSLGAALQFHYMIVFLGLFILWQLCMTFRVKKLRPKLWQWFAIIILTMMPLILFELKNNFLNLSGLIDYLTKNEYQAFEWGHTFRSLRGRSEQAIGMILGFGRGTNPVRTGVTRVILLGIGWLWLKDRRYQVRLVSLWVLLTIVAIAFYRGAIHPYYLAFIFPAVFILTGRILAEFKGWLLPLAMSFLLLFVSANVPELNRILAQSGNVASVRKTARFILDDANANQYTDYNLTLIDDTKDYRAQAFRYFVEVYGGKPLGEADYPQTKVLYVVSPYRQTDIFAMKNWEISSVLPARLDATWEFDGSENIYKLVRL